ncbi:GDSL esterase/lipase At5g55050 [Oryza sativa Japonica Group]|uniref:GDSL-like lipase/acylhydrolase n=2 Tax=Oryza sativa subsp. japonica TaxID=39947 RepID=A3AJV7_ORYSJ|nr:GDSL esterase/lipase At5g55050 [Oryza sativa Japonica Group]AAS07169.1 putative GDSL-like lipase/acylhydrolase [Oryza sativa Japonica Group]ABF97299.1 GDSL-like Lipase/Acylhydrolase family protein, expressed [Oryza sativa Japonica Group]EAZ27596.1 hypothetical protein OsJ_11543 [Oryza sativa Japonica Group]KAF2940008.1 hypothetical protein DAI22_03g239800 [Oryza sativa Japonica Group]BAF12469.1 Os03g0581400 [Oryza sativa Japonica Group]|eukprot:NP_001050555.1 Os03g0581400 [Oryza sativa Japonica Group]
MGFWRRCTPSTSACAGVCVVALLLVALACCPTRARGAAPAVYVLGDSQADVGNNNYLPATLPMYKANYPHNGVDYPGGKPTGRFSNGYNFVDYLADSLGVASPPPYLSISNTSVYLRGVNFSSGGSGVSNLTNMGQCISFDEQIDQHYSTVHATLVEQLGPRQASTHLAESLFSVAIGGNDIINRVLLSQLVGTQDQFISSLANSLKRQLQRMYDLGTRRLLFVGAAPLGCCLMLREQSPTKECHAEANYLSARYNNAVTMLLRDMSAMHPGMSYAFFDTYTALLQYIRQPEAYGYTEVKAACCGLGDNNAMFQCTPASSYCANRTSYMFWDIVHPTEITAKRLTKVAFDGSPPLVYPINISQLTAS